MTARAFLAGLACLAALAACGGTSVENRVQSEAIGADGVASVRVDGVVLTVEPPILYRASFTAGAGDSEHVATIADKPYGIRSGAFFIGDTSYGPVADGDRVLVSGDGVFVNDERRGDAP